MKLKNKVVLITGASQGIGYETALAFAKMGSKLVLTYNTNKTGGKDILNKCREYTEVILVKTDISKNNSIKNLVETSIKEYGKIDVLINNAGVATEKRFHNFLFSDVDYEVAVNLSGLIKTTLITLPYLKKSKESIIINLSSRGGKTPNKYYPVYSATKFGVRGFTQGLALELPKNTRIYSVNPWATRTQMHDFEEGVEPDVVADIIIRAVEEKLNKKSGDDIDCKDYY